MAQREDTFMGLAPGLNSSGEFVLGQMHFPISTISTAGGALVASSQSGTWFHTTAAMTTLSTYTLPYPEVGAFYGFVIGGADDTIASHTWRTPSSLVDIIIGGGVAGSTNTAVTNQTSGAMLGAVVGFLGLTATRYAFLMLSPEASTDFTSVIGSAGLLSWSAVDSTG
jgi:hypothetical protein